MESVKLLFILKYVKGRVGVVDRFNNVGESEQSLTSSSVALFLIFKDAW